MSFANAVCLGLVTGMVLVNPAMAQSAQQQDAAAAVVASQVESASAGNTTAVSVDPDVVLLGELRRDIEVERSRAELLGIQQQIQETREKLGESDAGDGNAVPSLIGLYGGGSQVTAEFLVGSGEAQTVLTARVGEWVTHRWRIERVLANGVVLAGRGGERRTVLFGRKSAPGVLGGGRVSRTGPMVPASATGSAVPVIP